MSSSISNGSSTNIGDKEVHSKKRKGIPRKIEVAYKSGLLPKIPTWINGEVDKYKITNQTLGDGTFSIVKLGLISNDKTKRVAVKIINKVYALNNSKRVSALRQEIEILFVLADHPSIVHLIEVIEDTDNVYLIFDEHVGDLHTHLSQQGGRLTESEVMMIFPQIVSAVAYCHENGIVHRDLKLENILYTYAPSATDISGRELKVFIADFGFAAMYDRNSHESPDFKRLTKWCGSPFTVAPEIVERKPYLPEPVDVWSLGSVLYTMLCGYPPFKSKSLGRMFRRTQKGKIKSFPRIVGAHARSLIKRMLTVDVEKRITLAEIKEHPWFMYAEGAQRSRTTPIELDQLSHESLGNLKKSKSMVFNGLGNTAVRRMSGRN